MQLEKFIQQAKFSLGCTPFMHFVIVTVLVKSYAVSECMVLLC